MDRLNFNMLADLTWGEAPVPQQLNDSDWGTALAAETGGVRLHADERALAEALPAARRCTFVAGRMALRRALQAHGASHDAAILRTTRGGPQLPNGITGSIAHKQTLAIAAVAPQSGTWQHVGIDLERRPTVADLHRPSIASRVLRAAERERVAALSTSPLRARELELVHFALKEAVYKAVDPVVQRYVGFLEVELQLAIHNAASTAESGSATVSLHMPEFAERPVSLSAAWRLDQEWIIAGALFGELPDS